ncbi:bifunctional diaminohydroxyphosphoribosylaminopyrimidine deaminase/5-amino-6-(5-phosphoribosylamino)uracil reductase RibD [Gammaproteobacteria bacterium]|nr:bifunctional diaminohydroxyphosphoribosylaminopyrimidine deaminase/5-amino-6-(5-phosphoribosylamino)uracil reductase RibD [Gammaproteobacteria bacterium]
MTHRFFLKKAYWIAKSFQGWCSPNPTVAALVVKNNQIIASGFHLGVGTNHAEYMAIHNAEEPLLGATLYVTLEPCSHKGKTPPCTDLIIQSGIKNIVFAEFDTNQQVRGQGAKVLSAAGINVIHLPTIEISQMYKPYHHWHKTMRPIVILKTAITASGAISRANKMPIQITKQETNLWCHQERYYSDAILTTGNVINYDNPSLNVRLYGYQLNKPLFILDPLLSLPKCCNILQGKRKIIIFHKVEEHSEIYKYWSSHPNVNLKSFRHIPRSEQLNFIIAQIGQIGIQRLWVECGKRLAHELVNQQLIHEWTLILSDMEMDGYALHLDKSLGAMQSIHYHWLNKHDIICQLTPQSK